MGSYAPVALIIGDTKYYMAYYKPIYSNQDPKVRKWAFYSDIGKVR